MGWFESLKKKVNDRQLCIKKKRTLIKHMTIPESEKLYKTYIDNQLIKIKRDENNNEIKIKLTPKEIKSIIYWRLDIDQIIETIPRLKKKIDN